MKKALPIIVAAVGGALVGAAAALLTAPQKGSDTRSAIKDFAKSHCPGLKDRQLERIADQIAQEIREVK